MVKRKLGALEKVDADLYIFQCPAKENMLTISAGRVCNTKSKKIPRPSSQDAFAGLLLTTCSSYIEDFHAQYYQYQNHREIFLAAPSSATDSGIVSLRDLIDFVSHVADCYPTITADFPNQLIEILSLHHAILEAELREKIVGSLVLLRRKEIIDSNTWVPLDSLGSTES